MVIPESATYASPHHDETSGTGGNAITTSIAVVGCLLLVTVGIGGVILYRKRMLKTRNAPV